MAEVQCQFIDYSNEKSLATIRVADAISDANITVLFNAINGVTLGNNQGSKLVTKADKDTGTAGKSTNTFAQREMKWLVKYIDNVNSRPGSLELPTADLAELATGDALDVGTGTAGETLVNALESHMLSRDGNAITVSEIKFVGRNT